MDTECSGRSLEFQGVGRREVIARFDGGDITSDGGALLLREVERQTKIVEQFESCFEDLRLAHRSQAQPLHASVV